MKAWPTEPRTLYGIGRSAFQRAYRSGLLQVTPPGTGNAREAGDWVPLPERRVIIAVWTLVGLGGADPTRPGPMAGAAARVAQAARTYEPNTLVDLSTLEPITDPASWVANRPVFALILRVPEPAQ